MAARGKPRAARAAVHALSLFVAGGALLGPVAPSARAQPREGSLVDDAAPSDAERAVDPEVEQQRLVAYVATGISAASLAVGVVSGALALDQYRCLEDVLACNQRLPDPIQGDELFEARAQVDQKAFVADMAFLVAAASAAVAVSGYLLGFVFTGDGEITEAGAQASGPAPAPPVVVGVPHGRTQ